MLLIGCDSFDPSEALLPLTNASTDPTALHTEGDWVAVYAVSEGESYEFPQEGFTVSFSKEGDVGGKVSVNSNGGQYTASAEGALTVKQVFVTLVGDTKEALRLTEVFLGELQQADQFEVAGRTLQVRDDEGDGVRFQRRASE